MVAHSQSYLSLRRGDCLNSCLYSEDTLLWSWTRTGKARTMHDYANTQIGHRSPFNDSLVASGSDDGKV